MGPATLTTVLLGAGVVLILVAIPLARRMIPPNWAYGVRIEITMKNPAIWYEVNAQAGRDLVVVGAIYLMALALAILVNRGRALVGLQVLAPVIVLVVGLIISSARVLTSAAKLAGSQER